MSPRSRFCGDRDGKLFRVSEFAEVALAGGSGSRVTVQVGLWEWALFVCALVEVGDTQLLITFDDGFKV